MTEIGVAHFRQDSYIAKLPWLNCCATTCTTSRKGLRRQRHLESWSRQKSAWKDQKEKCLKERWALGHSCLLHTGVTRVEVLRFAGPCFEVRWLRKVGGLILMFCLAVTRERAGGHPCMQCRRLALPTCYHTYWPLKMPASFWLCCKRRPTSTQILSF